MTSNWFRRVRHSLNRPWRDVVVAIAPSMAVLTVAVVIAARYIDPPAPDKIVISTDDEDGDYTTFAKQYREILKKQGVELVIRPSKGPLENLARLEDEDASDDDEVDAAFVQDGIGSTDEQPDVLSLGSLLYEPLWVFYRSSTADRDVKSGRLIRDLQLLSELNGLRLAIGREGRGTRTIALRALEESGVDLNKTNLVAIGGADAAEALKKGTVDAAFFLATPEDSVIDDLIHDPRVKLMDLAHAEALARLMPALHHLVLPRGVLDLKNDLPHQDVNLVASTATMLVREDLHPSLAFLLLKTLEQVHSPAGIFEAKGEFPSPKDDQFPLSPDAKQFYKSGGPFWQRFLPYWLAAWVDRFLVLVLPVLVLVLPLIRLVPKIYQWRIRTRIYRRYGELKYLETQMSQEKEPSPHAYRDRLDQIEARVNEMRVPLEFTEHLYSLRGHIQFVRDRIETTVEKSTT